MKRLVLLASFLAISIAPAFAQSVPVKVGGSEDMDACGSIGAVSGLDPNGDAFLSVRRGPGTGYREIERLEEGFEVIICETRGNWFGIVYDDGRDDFSDCGLSSPIAQLRRYTGPCKSGWVFGRYIRGIAG